MEPHGGYWKITFKEGFIRGLPTAWKENEFYIFLAQWPSCNKGSQLHGQILIN
jgi:hypothetical protein